VKATLNLDDELEYLLRGCEDKQLVDRNRSKDRFRHREPSGLPGWELGGDSIDHGLHLGACRLPDSERDPQLGYG
jgi:hypothetical protein